MDSKVSSGVCFDDARYEDFGNGPVAMSRPTLNHSTVSGNLFKLFSAYLRNNVCKVFLDVKSVLPDGKYFCPDLSVLCDKSRRNKGYVKGISDVVVEILSPTTLEVDRKVKLPLYFENGAKEVWLISIRERTVTVYMSVDVWNVYPFYTPGDIELMTEAEISNLVRDRAESKLFPDFKPLLSEVFADVVWEEEYQ